MPRKPLGRFQERLLRMNTQHRHIALLGMLFQLSVLGGSLFLTNSCHRGGFDETKLVGTWDQVLMDTTKRLTFLSNHEVTVLMEQDGKFEPYLWGNWRVEGNRLILTLKNPTQDYSSEDVYTMVRITSRKIDFDHASSFERIE